MLVRAVQLSPNDGFIVDSLGWALYKLGDFPGAVAQLERAAELEPSEAVINDHLGDAYWKVGRKREARVQWHRALSLAPSTDLDEAKVREKLDLGLPDTTQQ
jgi:Flp pilus assembly protein TadD